MANPTPDYPAAIHTPIDISAKASSALGSTPQKHSQVHGKIEEEIVEVQKKLGTGESDASGATTGQVLTKKADGSTQWTTPSGGGGGGAVDSVNGQTGVVVLDTDDISDATQTNKYVTAAEKTKLSNLSGTNTGDQTLSGLGGALDTSGLYTPRRRPRPPHIVKMIQSFDQTGHSWFSGGTTVSSNPADTDSEVGVHASIVTGNTGTSTYSKYNFGTFNATDRNLVALVRVEDMTAISGIVLRIGSDTNVTSNYYDLQVSAGNVSSSILNTGEWVPVTFSWAKSVAVGSPDRSALKSLQFRVPAFNSKSTTVRFKSIGISEQRGPYCLISFDDNQVSANLALPYMNKYGFSGTMYSIAERIDTPNYQTMEDVLSMQNDFNWEIACHSYTAAAHDSPNGMEDLTLPQLDTELRNLKKWALENNISGSDHFVWPKGRFRPDMIPVAERYFVSAGMVSHYINQTLPTFTPMRMARRGVTSTTTLANIQTEIDTAIANNTSIELLFHKIVPSGATGSTEYNAADFAAAIDYIASSGIEVRTISEAVYGYCDADGTKLDSIEFGADVTDAGNVGSSIDGSSAKTTPVDADTMPLIDSAASNVLKKVTWANIKAALKTYFDSLYRSLARVTFSNADYTITATKDSVIAQIGTMSASRIVTLPAANSVPAGTEFMIMDSSGSVTPTNTIVITRAGSDTINGGTTETISSEYSWRRLVSDGTSKWSIDAGIVRQSQFNASLRAPQIMKNARYKTPATQPVAATTSALTAGRCYFHCFGIPSSGITTLTDFFFEVTTGWAGNTRVGLFKITDGKDPENGVTLIADLGNVDLTAAAQKYVSGLSQVCSEEWLIIGLYVHNATPVFRVMNTTGNAGTAAFQQTGYHSDATYTQYRPITGYYITGVDYSAGMPSSTGALSILAGGTNASPLIAAKFSY